MTLALTLPPNDRHARLGVLMTALVLHACGAPTRSTAASAVERGTNPPQVISVPPAPPASTEEQTGAEPAAHAVDQRVSAWLRELAASRASDDAETDPWKSGDAIPVDLCRRITGYQKPFESCSLRLLANGTAGAVAVVDSCGEHLCDVRYWVFAGDDRRWTSEVHYGGLELEVSPDHRWLFVGQLRETGPEPVEMGPRGPLWNYEFSTEQVDLSRQVTVATLPCGSLVLSPKGRYYVCRDLAGNVLRVPSAEPRAAGLEPFVRVTLEPGQEIQIGGSFNDYPAAVSFPSPTELEYTLYLGSTDVVTRRVPWLE